MSAPSEVNLLLGRLRGVKLSGSGWSALCPAHDDRNPSLTIAIRDDKILVKCHAGCGTETVLAAIGLAMADLFTDVFPARQPREVAAYRYCDETGVLLFQVVRFQPKEFRQCRPDGQGGWIWNLDGIRRVLYRLAALQGQREVFIVEGEKDADRLAALGLAAATTNPGGAGQWRPEYSAQLVAAGVKRVVILPDNDAPGEAHGRVVAAACLGAGLEVKVIDLPGLGPKGDVSDWLAAGGTREALLALVDAAPALTAADLASSAGPVLASDAPGARRLHFIALGDLLAEPPEVCSWLVDGRLPTGGLSLLAGKPKSGKSTLARCLALAVARGEPWLGFPTRQGPVLYLGLEEKREEVRKHFEAMGARSGDEVSVFIAPSPDDGLAQLRAEAERRRPALVVVDPLLRFVRVRDANDYAAVTAALEPLLALARQTDAHLLVVHHLGKGERVGGDAILGSTALFAAVDTALLLRRSEKHGYRTLASIQRYGADLEEVTLTLEPETRIVRLGLPRREAEEAELAGPILDYLAEEGEAREEAAIAAAVAGDTGVKRRALRALVEQGRVTREGAGKRGEPFRYRILVSLSNSIGVDEQTRNANHGLSPEDDGAYSRLTQGGSETPQGEPVRRETAGPAEVNLWPGS